MDIREADLFPVISSFFVDQGFTIRGEVKGCDLVAIREETIVIAELKLQFNLKVLYQAVRRLKITPLVYIVILEPKSRSPKTNWPQIKTVVRRLKLGLITVAFNDATAHLDVIFQPKEFRELNQKKLQAAIIKEFYGRSGNYQPGGTTRTLLNSAYREEAIKIASLLHLHKKLTAAELRKLGCSLKTNTILKQNYYGWFRQVADKKFQFIVKFRAHIQRDFPQLYQLYFETK